MKNEILCLIKVSTIGYKLTSPIDEPGEDFICKQKYPVLISKKGYNIYGIYNYYFIPYINEDFGFSQDKFTIDELNSSNIIDLEAIPIDNPVPNWILKMIEEIKKLINDRKIPNFEFPKWFKIYLEKELEKEIENSKKDKT